MNFPKQINIVLNLLHKNEYEAFLVGGCVRDFILQRDQKDFDITTDAEPSDVLRLFKDFRVIETGLKHGTVTVIIDALPIEITTYRIDGDYSDNRRPDQVQFTKSLRDDLARRDFTMNAICYTPDAGFIDYFCGLEDIKNHVIKAVGDPEERFSEDALRILRAIRFASVYGFQMEEKTRNAIFNKKHLLKNIAAERIAAELFKTLCGDFVLDTLLEYYPVLGEVIPELLPMAGFEQHTKYHLYDVLTHTLLATKWIQNKPHLKLAAFLHDMGKPSTFSREKNGTGHFYGHEKESVHIAKQIMERLKLDNFTKNRVSTLIEYHDAKIPPTEKSIKKWLNKLGPEAFFDLLEVQKADALAHHPNYQYRAKEIEKLKADTEMIVKQKLCFSLSDLCINGDDLIRLGIKEGKEVGAWLNIILEAVMSGKLKNEKEKVEKYILKSMKRGKTNA